VDGFRVIFALGYGAVAVLIPGFETLTVDNPIKCEKCGKLILKKRGDSKKRKVKDRR